uniref:HAT C-terminal dimerisation domain-containing protein n=1 Tax=Gouania willdenowi TaxID=441366 RepID=A0A8C5H0M9_GOUWI
GINRGFESSSSSSGDGSSSVSHTMRRGLSDVRLGKRECKILFPRINVFLGSAKQCGILYSMPSSLWMLAHLEKKHPMPSSLKQSSMDAFRVRKLDISRAEKITGLMTSMVAKDVLPVSFVEGVGFRELMAFLEPDYQVPCRKTTTVRLEKMYEDKAASLRESLCAAEHLAITTDAWTALTTESYVTVTAHYFEDWKMKTALLQTRAMPERHTAENLANVLGAAAEDWGIADKIVACVHDNATNVTVATSRHLEWESHRCFAHTLQLAVNDGFKLNSIANVVGGASRLVSHFHHSTVASEALKKKQAIQLKEPHRLIQYVKTRWNSIHDMFERLLEQRWTIAAVLSDREVTKLSDARTLDLTDANWHTMEELLPVLRALKSATTVSARVCVFFFLIDYMILCLYAGKWRIILLKYNVSDSLTSRMEPENTGTAKKAAFIASFLDPRHKHLKFTTKEVKEAVQEKVRDLLSGLRAVSGDSARVDDDESGPAKRAKQVDAMVSFFGEDYFKGDTVTSDHSEIERYTNEEGISPSQDPALWWSLNESRFKNLSRLAKAYLCIPATSVPAERVFSAAGLVVNRLRSRLLPKHQQVLHVLKAADTTLVTHAWDSLSGVFHFKNTQTLHWDSWCCKLRASSKSVVWPGGGPGDTPPNPPSDEFKLL